MSRPFASVFSMGTLVIAIAAGASACSDDPLPTTRPPPPAFSASELMDPENCSGCHPNHLQEWSGSMHAYASDDPVFRAMNARGQRETSGALGSFCVQCHAPMALKTGATTDGLNLDQVAKPLKGVTCYFCHSVGSVEGAHNNPITLANDGVLRAAIRDPVSNEAHGADYSPLLDRSATDSATLCGSCHDIDTSHGAHIERTFAEWQTTVFSHAPAELTCGECHMDGKTGFAAEVTGAPQRQVHGHMFPAVDLALTTFPQADAQRAAVQSLLDTTLQSLLCVRGANIPGATTLQLVLENVAAGHDWPSGATQDRRAWIEIVAYLAGNVIYQSGAIADEASITASTDADLWLLRDCMFGDDGKQVSMFWNAASVDSNLLPGPVTINQADPNYYATHVVRSFPRKTSTPAALAQAPDKVTMRVRLLPIGYDVLDDLIASKDLDPSIKAIMKPMTLAGSELTWTSDTATLHYGDQGIPVSCVSGGLLTGANTATAAPEHTRCAP
jgi:hypothetical protein